MMMSEEEIKLKKRKKLKWGSFWATASRVIFIVKVLLMFCCYLKKTNVLATILLTLALFPIQLWILNIGFSIFGGWQCAVFYIVLSLLTTYADGKRQAYLDEYHDLMNQSYDDREDDRNNDNRDEDVEQTE